MTIGVDIVKIDRIKKIIEKNREKFYEKIFTIKEINYIYKKNHNRQTVAGLFASKEAISKALGSGIGDLNWKDIEILHNNDGKPYLNLNQKITEKLQKINLSDIQISISHERDYAIAFANGERKNKDGFLNDMVLDKSLSNLILTRKKDAHKGDFGRVLIIGGSKGMAGSIYLSSRASMRSGTGLTYTIVPKSLETIMSIKLTEEILKFAEDKDKGQFIKESLGDILDSFKDMDVIGIGPGMRFDIDKTYILEEVIKNAKVPLVIDADGINSISENIDILLEKNNEIVITPHPGELSRLLGISIEEIQKNRIFYSKYISKKYNIIIVLKGHHTIVCNKEDIFINHTGNPGMATGGSGDVLTGIITSFIAQGLNPFEASKLGVYIHGLAGDFAKYKKGEYGLIARDILENIPYIIKMMIDKG